MKTEIEIFTDLAWQEKIDYIVSFYQGMIKKTNNSEYVARFKTKIDEVKGYKDNEENNNELINIYKRIMGARDKTKERQVEEMKQHIENEKEKLVNIQANNNEQNPDEYLAEAISKI